MNVTYNDELIKKLLYRSIYRGSREMDYLFSTFAQNELKKLPQEELVLYSELLNQEDPDIYSWLMGFTNTPEKFLYIVEKIKNHANSLV